MRKRELDIKIEESGVISKAIELARDYGQYIPSVAEEEIVNGRYQFKFHSYNIHTSYLNNRRNKLEVVCERPFRGPIDEYRRIKIFYNDRAVLIGDKNGKNSAQIKASGYSIERYFPGYWETQLRMLLSSKKIKGRVLWPA